MKALSERFPVVSLASVVRAVGAVHHLEQSRVAKLSALAKFHNSLIECWGAGLPPPPGSDSCSCETVSAAWLGAAQRGRRLPRFTCSDLLAAYSRIQLTSMTWCARNTTATPPNKQTLPLSTRLRQCEGSAGVGRRASPAARPASASPAARPGLASPAARPMSGPA